MSFDQERIDRLRKPGPVREIMEAAGANGYPPYVWFKVEDVLNKHVASSSQGLTFRWEEDLLFIGDFWIASVEIYKGPYPYGAVNKMYDELVEFEKEDQAREQCETWAKAFIAKLEGRE